MALWKIFLFIRVRDFSKVIVYWEDNLEIYENNTFVFHIINKKDYKRILS